MHFHCNSTAHICSVFEYFFLIVRTIVETKYHFSWCQNLSIDQNLNVENQKSSDLKSWLIFLFKLGSSSGVGLVSWDMSFESHDSFENKIIFTATKVSTFLPFESWQLKEIEPDTNLCNKILPVIFGYWVLSSELWP